MKDKVFDQLRNLYEWLIKWSGHKYNTIALSILSFLEASIFPIPVDPLLLTMGFSKPKKSIYYAFLTTTFSVLGAAGGYYIGFYAWQSISPFFFDYVFSQEKFEGVVQILRDATFLSIFVAGFSPIPFKIFTISGGVVAAPFMPFIAASILSRGLRYFILGTLVYFMGEKAKIWIDNNFEKMTYIVSALLIVAVVLLKLVI